MQDQSPEHRPISVPHPASAVMEPPEPGFRRNMLTLTAIFISTMAALDLTIVSVALPYMAGSLDAGGGEIAWAVTMFTIGQAIVNQPVPKMLHTILFTKLHRRTPEIHFLLSPANTDPFVSPHTSSVDMRLTRGRGIKLQRLIRGTTGPDQLQSFPLLPPDHILPAVTQCVFLQ